MFKTLDFYLTAGNQEATSSLNRIMYLPCIDDAGYQSYHYNTGQPDQSLMFQEERETLFSCSLSTDDIIPDIFAVTNQFAQFDPGKTRE